MRQTRIVTLLLILPLLISLSACGKSPEKARKELAQMNVEFTKNKFLVSAGRGDATVVDLFLTAGMDANSKDEDTGYTALHLAASKGGNTATVQKLLAKGANVNAKMQLKTGETFTAFQMAARAGHRDIAMFLAGAGAKY